MGGNQGNGHDCEVRGVGGGGVLDDNDGSRGRGEVADTFGELSQADLIVSRGRTDAGQASAGVGGRRADRVGEVGQPGGVARGVMPTAACRA